MVYNPIEGSDDYNLISTATYENYMEAENPFPLEILSTVNSQPKLPRTYRLETNGSNILYNFTYEFDASGRALKRTTSSNTGFETTTYTYN